MKWWACGVVAMALVVGCGDDAAPMDAATDVPLDSGDASLDVSPDVDRMYVPEPFTPTDETRAYCALDSDVVEDRITELLARLSVQQKADLMHGAALGPEDGLWTVDGIADLGIPGFQMLDGPRGLSRFSMKSGTAFPVAMLRGATWDAELEREVGVAMARELWSAGADVILAPTINILRHARWGRAQETYSEDPVHMGELGVAFIEGVQSEGVLASAKHFAVNSIEDTRHTVNVEIDERTLREIYLPHFRRAVREARVASVMSAYNQVNGFYCDLNAQLLTEILKDEWGFQGFVESDWILGTHADVDSVRAGLDIEMPSGVNFRRLPAAVASGDIGEPEIDRSVRRILRAQFCYELDTRSRPVDEVEARETPEHLALAQRVAERGIVLLRNEGALPFPDTSNIVVMGRIADVENIGDTGSSSVRPAGDIVTALEGLEARIGGTVTHIPHVDDMRTLDAAQLATVSAADAVVFVTGLEADDEGEATVGAGDRDSLGLPDDQVALLESVAAATDFLTVVVEAGGPITMPWADQTEAILFAFYPGQRGGAALANILVGDVNPSGRLPFSIPVDEADLPLFDNTSENVTYDFFHGYRHLEREGTPAAFAFGFGLGYTLLDYGAMTVSDPTPAQDDVITIEFDLTNVGTMDAIETVQLYVTAEGSRVTRAPRDLRAFTSVALTPSETARVSIELSIADLAFWDVDAMAWEIEAIDYTLHLSRDAADSVQTATIRLE